jgi:hypothetical protein
VTKEEFVKLRREFALKPPEELLALLSSEDLKIRFLAEMSLRDATGT